MAVKCASKNCSVKNAKFAYSKTDKSKYCKGHSVEGMINVISKRCEVDDCDKQPNFNFKGQTKGIRCFDHRIEGMINVISKRCEADDCDTIPAFNFKGQTKGVRCFDHRLEGMINVISNRCEADDCDKQSNFNFKGQTKGVRCFDHRLEGMINVISNRCEADDCGTRPNFNFKGKTKGIRCFDHRIEGMIDVRNKRCVSCGLFRAEKSKEYMCHQCFIFNNPNHEFSRHYKTKELTFTKLLQQDLYEQGIDCILDSKISGGCSRRRPDVFIDLLTHVLIIEIDENQHLSYNESCEYVRTIELNEDIGHRPMYIIRLNPDSYKLDGKSVRGCFTSKMELNKKEFGHRYSTLFNTVLDLTASPPERLIESIELFFTETD